MQLHNKRRNLTLALTQRKTQGYNSHAEAHLRLAVCYQYRDDYDKARHHLKNYLAIAKGSDYSKEKIQDATEALDKIGQGEIILPPAEKLIEKAKILDHAGQYTTVAETLKKARELQNKPSYYIEDSIGDAYFAAADYSNAIKHYSIALTIIDNHRTRLSRAAAYIELDQCTLAIEDAEQVISTEATTKPGFHSHAEAHFYLAYCHSSLQSLQIAQHHADTSVSIASNHNYLPEDLKQFQSFAQELTKTTASLSNPETSPKQYSSPPPMTIDPAGSYTATIRTNKGNIVVELLPGPAPKTVNNFVFLANEGFYDGVIFHRVIPDFMIQGGDPTGTGTGDAGYKFEDEINPMFVFDRAGILAMANSGPNTNTNGSQFFITTAPTTHLNGYHTIFGRVIEGQTVAEAISVVSRGAGDKPNSPVVIDGIDIN